MLSICKIICISIILQYFNFLLAEEPIKPIPLDIQYNLQKAKLGKKLFFDTKLSKDNTISCATCHKIEMGGDDNLPFSFGIQGQKGNINAPTVLNSIFNFRQFWNGRAKTLQEQAIEPIENPIEMGHNFQELLLLLKKDKNYLKTFHEVYEDGITKENIADALAEFEKTLITPNAPFDKYLRGDKNAITPQQKKGYETFKAKGCIICHNGINIGGNLYAKVGIVNEKNFADKGLYLITKNPQDTYMFKVPSLRNITLTSPYLHNGSLNSLYDTVKLIAFMQLGIELSDQDTKNIIAFLHSLEGKVKGLNNE